MDKNKIQLLTDQGNVEKKSNLIIRVVNIQKRKRNSFVII